MSIGRREVRNRLPPDQIINELPFFDYCNRRHAHAVIIKLIAARQTVPLKCGLRRIVHHGNKRRQHTTLERGSKLSHRAPATARLRLASRRIVSNQRCKHIARRVRRKHHRPAILFVHHGCLAQLLQCCHHLARIGDEHRFGRNFFRCRHQPRGRAIQPHPVLGLSASGQRRSEKRLSAPRNTAFTVNKIFIHHGKARRSPQQLHFRVFAIRPARHLEHVRNARFVKLKFRQRANRRQRLGVREIVHRLIQRHRFHQCLLRRQSFASRLVRRVGRQPQRVAQRVHIIFHRRVITFTLSLAEIAVLFVISNSHDGTQRAHMHALISNQRAELRLAVKLLDVRNPVLDVIRPRDAFHF